VNSSQQKKPRPKTPRTIPMAMVDLQTQVEHLRLPPPPRRA
jgi:hypothetical protein